MKSNSFISSKRENCRLAFAAVLASLVASITTAVAQITITCPADMTVPNDEGVCSAVVDYPAPVVTGTTTGDGVITTPPSGSTFPVGTNEVVGVITNALGEQASCSFIIIVVDVEAPVITDAAPNKSLLWPPNHKMVKVTVDYEATDNCDPAVESSLSVTSNESENGQGDGNTSGDWEVLDAHHVLLRAERSGNGDGRVYTITITSSDVNGNSSSEAVTVNVPHSKGKGIGRGNGGGNGNGNSGSNGKGKGKGHNK